MAKYHDYLQSSSNRPIFYTVAGEMEVDGNIGNACFLCLYHRQSIRNIDITRYDGPHPVYCHFCGGIICVPVQVFADEETFVDKLNACILYFYRFGYFSNSFVVLDEPDPRSQG